MKKIITALSLVSILVAGYSGIWKLFYPIGSANRPIEFWGKVVDVGSAPLSDVTVEYMYTTEHGVTVAQGWGAQRTNAGNVVTDANGEFHIGGMKGHVLEIRSLKKEGFVSTIRHVMGYNYYGDSSDGLFVANESTPIVFAMVRRSESDDVVPAVENGRNVSIPVGGVVRWDFRAGRVDPNGEVMFAFDVAAKGGAGRTSRERLIIQMLGGGIIEGRPDDLVYMAPEGGYAERLVYPEKQQKNGVPWRTFYFKAADGTYGRLQVELFWRNGAEKGRIIVRCWHNRSGERLLEAGSKP